MKRRAMMTRILSLMAMALLAGGCDRITPSGIPKALNTDALLATAGRAQGITLGGSGSGESLSTYAVDAHRDFVITIPSGTLGQVVFAFRGEVKRQIESMGGEIHGTGFSGTGETDARAFSYSYRWKRNEGFVRVGSFVGTNGQVEITLFCYEHRR